MIIYTNPELMSAMQNSYSLQQKLNNHEINLLIEKAFKLGQKAQAQLLEKLKQEEKEVSISQVKKYKSDINTLVKQFKKKAEKEQEKENNDFIKNIDNILGDL